MTTPIRDVAQHYAPVDVALDAVLTDLSSSYARLSTADLAGADQFHSGGTEATRLLAQRAAITAADHVLDVGGGFGGPARLLAEQVGCHVTVVDLTEGYLRVGEKLTERAGLADLVEFQQGNALDLPFADNRFDVVWTQHASMNIADKAGLYAQIHRVLRPGGRLALHDATLGSGERHSFRCPSPKPRPPAFSCRQKHCEPRSSRRGFTNGSGKICRTGPPPGLGSACACSKMQAQAQTD